jgi:hypothetical protein
MAEPTELMPSSASPLATQTVDPNVSHEKFDREIAEYRAIEPELQRRGWWMLEASFPKVFVVFATPKLRPATVVFGVELDFTNYDLEPPSVRLVDPFTRRPYLCRELPSRLLRGQMVDLPIPGPGGAAMQQIVPVPLMQGAPDEIPFLCLPGVREYHQHPAHTGDSWLLHRVQGEGRLYFLLNAIHKYGVEPINDFSFGLQVVGFRQGEPPL